MKGKVSKTGYKRTSPDRNNDYNIIPSGRITMQDVDFPVYGVDEYGNSQMMYPGAEYQFPGNQVFEIPMAQRGMSTRRVNRILNDNRDLNWVQRLYEANTPSIQIPGLDGPSTHYMESADGRVYPTVVQMPDGSLQYLGDQAYDYANETGEYIQFKNDRQAQRFAKSYKKGTGVLEEYGKGGLTQWFDEKWVDVKTGKECGRSGKDKDGRPYPACRPSRRVNETTPKTTSEMSSSEKAKFKREKTSGKRINYNHKRAQQGGQMSASAGYDSWYNSPMAAGRYTFTPGEPSEYYVEGYGTKQGPGIAAGMDYTNPKYRTQGMIRAGLDPEVGANLRLQGGYRFNPIDNRREQLTWGPYGGSRYQTENYYQGVPAELAINNLQPDLIYGVNARYNKALANRGRFNIEGDLGMAIGLRPEGNLGEGFDPRFYGAIKATYSPPMYKNTRNNNDWSGKRKPRPTTYSSGYQDGGEKRQPTSWLDYANPMNWGVYTYDDAGTFNQAFAKARGEGQDEFMWYGNRYNTQLAPQSEQATVNDTPPARPSDDIDLDFNALKKGVSFVESRNGKYMWNPESSATGLYGQRFSEIGDTPLYAGTREDFRDDTEAQERVFGIRYNDGLPGSTSLKKDAIDLYREYYPIVKKNNIAPIELAALSNFLGRQGTRYYLGYVLRDGRNLSEVFPKLYGDDVAQKNKTPEEYLKLFREAAYAEEVGGEVEEKHPDYSEYDTSSGAWMAARKELGKNKLFKYGGKVMSTCTPNGY